jgi:hypothetical protein
MVKIGHITDHEGLTIPIFFVAFVFCANPRFRFGTFPKALFSQPFLNLCVQRETGSEAIPSGMAGISS